MTPYWLMFAAWAVGAIGFSPQRLNRTSTILFTLAAILTALVIGLRYRVGGDWANYQQIYDDIYYMPLSTAVTYTDPIYGAFNWLSGQFRLGVWPVNLACGMLFMFGTARLASKQPNPWLAVLVAVPYLVIVVAMGYTRQAAAIGVICYAVADASETRLIRLVVLTLIAALLHKTAILLLPIMLVPVFRRNLLLGFLGILVFAGLFWVVLSSSTGDLVANYVQSDYDSQGAMVRVSMNVLAAIVLLLTFRRSDFSPFQRSFWVLCSILSIASLVLLFVVSASSGVDRIALFLIPLQMVAISRLPYVFAKAGTALPSVLIGVVAYCFLVQFVWLGYADNARGWLPYRTVLAQGAM